MKVEEEIAQHDNKHFSDRNWADIIHTLSLPSRHRMPVRNPDHQSGQQTRLSWSEEEELWPAIHVLSMLSCCINDNYCVTRE